MGLKSAFLASFQQKIVWQISAKETRKQHICVEHLPEWME
jgi:hypothetical protein